ncbi:MAG: FAD-dependent oxidoreductase [Betaproteobacteria bacterium]
MKRILLVGAGHAHCVVLRSLVEDPLYGARVALVSPAAKQLYSGMLPGVVAGLYRRHQAEVDVARLAEAAYAEFIEGTVVSLDAAQRVATLADGTELAYEFASVNAGSLMDLSLPGAAQHALRVKPFEAFVRDVRFPPRVALVGGGAAGAELAMAFRHRGSAVTLFSDKLAFNGKFQGLVTAAMRERGVDYRPGMAATAIAAGPVVVAGSARQEFDLVVMTTGAVAQPWLAASGLETDARGFLLVDAELRASNGEVFAAGDCASLRGDGHPKSGLYSVRHGEMLALNLRKLVEEKPLRPYRPQKRGLVLLSCGDRYAVAGRGGWAAEGRWVWRWKDWIDRRWVRGLAV